MSKEVLREFAQEHPRTTVAVGTAAGMILGILAEVARNRLAESKIDFVGEVEQGPDVPDPNGSL